MNIYFQFNNQNEWLEAKFVVKILEVLNEVKWSKSTLTMCAYMNKCKSNLWFTVGSKN